MEKNNVYFFKTLFRFEVIALRDWFRKNKKSKLFVAAVFFVLSLLLLFSIYRFALIYFRSLVPFELYGLLTANYLFQASIFVIGYFVVFTTMLSVNGFLNSKNSNFEYLSVMPQPLIRIWEWYFVKTFIINLVVSLLLLTPVAIAFYAVFMKAPFLIFVMRYLFVLISLLIICQSLGELIAYILSVLLDRFYEWFVVMGLVLFVYFFAKLMTIVFPTKLMTLYNAPAEEYVAIYNSLPLLNKNLPSYWLHDVLVYNNYLAFVKIVSLTLFLFSALFLVIKHFFKKITERVCCRLSATKKFISITAKCCNPLIIREVVGFTRSVKEFGYYVFMLLLMIFFYIFLKQAQEIRPIQQNWQEAYITFVFVWLMFLQTAYLLRVTYPLLSKEKLQAWHLFTAPLSIKKILYSKLAFSLLISIPQMLALFSIIYSLFPMPEGRLFISVFGLLVSVILHLVVFIIGVMLPNFSDGSDVDRASTSVGGIITLIVAALLTVLTAFMLFRYVSGEIALLNMVALIIFLAIITDIVYAVLYENEIKVSLIEA